MTTTNEPGGCVTMNVQSISNPDSRSLQHEALLTSAALRLGMLSFDELRVIDTVMERVLKIGRDSYAPLDLARDQRDWGAEAAAELADTLFYLAAREVAANDRRRERLRCEVADEGAARVDTGLRELADITAKFDTGGTEP
jgi:hypothetical protein